MPVDSKRVEAVFLAAVETSDPDARAAVLDRECGGDSELRKRVEALLQADQRPDTMLDGPALVGAVEPTGDATVAVDSSTARPPSLASGDTYTAAGLSTPGAEPVELTFLQPSTKPGSIGRLGHYEVMKVIGKGGFGVVLQGFDERLHRVVAIKVLAPAYAANGAARKRFIREARAAAAVKNEHVVGIYDVQEDSQPPFLVMECIDGVSLQDKIDKQGTLGIKEVLRIGMQIAEGLANAHRQGLVHRDIKPSNILLENGVERVKITDFGLARAVDDASVTQSGTVAGTPMYMSPEQAEGVPIDHRSDLFSLGTVLYAMCTGHPPFRASGTHAVLKRVIDASPRPIREINNEVPDWLCAIVSKLHAKKPADRFQTAKEVAELLGQRLADVQAGRAIERAGSVSDGSESPAPSAPAAATSGFSLSQLPLAAWIGCALWVGVLLLGLAELQNAMDAHLARGLGTLLTALTLLYAVSCIGFFYMRRRATGAEPRPYRIALFLGIPSLCIVGLLVGWVKDPVASVSGLFAPAEMDKAHLIVQLDGPDLLSVEVWPTLNKVDDGKRPTFTTAPTGGYQPVVSEAGVGRLGFLLPAGNYWVFAKKNEKEVHRELVILAPGETHEVRVAARTPPPEPGWVQLFNGKDLTGWKQHPQQQGAWAVKDGLLVGESSATHHLFSEREYDNFHLRAKVKLSDEGNSGIFFRSEFGLKLADRYPRGHEVQILNTYPQPNAPRTGSLFVLKDLQGQLVKNSVPEQLVKPGEWCDLEIIAQGARLVVRVNDKTTVDFQDDIRVLTKGHLVLQVMSDVVVKKKNSVVHFKKIEIKELPPEEPGWVQLFNGKDLTGWTRNGPQWSVKDSILTATNSGTLSSNRTYHDFHIRAKMRLTATGATITFRDNKTTSLGQLALGFDRQDVRLSLQPGGKGKDSPHPAEITGAMLKDTWCDLDLIVRGSRVIVKINDVRTAERVLEGLPATGKIKLNTVTAGGAFEFKKIEIKELPPEEPGWVQLFNGKDLTGWQTNEPLQWKVEGNLLVGADRTTLRWLKDYENFHLRAEVKFNDVGISHIGGRSILGNTFMVSLSKNETGSLRHYIEPAAKRLVMGRAYAPDTWVTLDVIVRGKHVEVRVDGKMTAEATIEALPNRGRLFLMVDAAGAVLHVRKIEIKEFPPPPRLPDAADQVLPALAGNWKGEYTQKIYAGKPDVKKISAVAVNDWVVGQRWLRQRVQIGNEAFQSVTTFEPVARLFRDWFFHSRGLIFGPTTGKWEPATRTVTWTNLPDSETILLMTLRFVDADTLAGEILIRDKAGKTVFEMSSLMKRTTEQITIDENVAAGPLPKEMAVLDKLVGDWVVTGVTKDANNPDGLMATWPSSSRKILGGRVIATHSTGLPGKLDGYALATYDAFGKAYGRWVFKSDGSALEYGGGWDVKIQTMKWHWAAKDGSHSTALWHLRDADRFDWQVITKDALGKATLDVQATSVRQSEPGWTPLWNSKDLDGWTDLSPKNAAWKFDNGILEAAGKQTNLVSKRSDLGDFHLRMEMMANADTRAKLMLRSDANGLKGYEMELGIARTQRTPGSILREVPVKRGRSAADGLVEPNEWFTLEVIAQGNRFIVKHNDKVALDWTDDRWVEERGAIALIQEDKCGVLKIRRMEIKPLADAVGWGEWIDPKLACKHEIKNGRLTIDVPKGAFNLASMFGHAGYPSEFKGNQDAPRLLQDIEGDFTLQVKLADFPRPDFAGNLIPLSKGIRGAGLLLWIDDRTFLKFLGYQAGDGMPKFGRPTNQMWCFAGPKLVEDRIVHGLGVPYLQIERRGDDLHLRTSSDGKKWDDFGKNPLDKWAMPKSLKVGIVAINATPIDARFVLEDFRLSRPRRP